jgi:hypothetical protein
VSTERFFPLGIDRVNPTGDAIELMNGLSVRYETSRVQYNLWLALCLVEYDIQ